MPAASGAFRSTEWSVVLRVVDGKSDELRRSEALQRLCQAYWKPLYVFVRRNGRSPEDAEDTTQGFIAYLIDGEALKSVDRSKGKFRSFLLASLRNFLTNDYRRRTTQKRGGAVPHVSLNDPAIEEHYQLESPESRTPEEMFDRSWAYNTLAEARSRTREEYARAKRLERFDHFEQFLPGASGAQSADAEAFASLGATLGMQEGTVKVEIHRLRKRFGIQLRGVVADTLENPDEVDDELRYLISVVGNG